MLDLPLAKPLPPNEPVLSYAPGSPERQALKSALSTLASERPDVPHVIGGKELRDGAPFEVKAPHDHGLVLATAMAALGAGTRLDAIRRAGLRPLLLAGFLFVWLIIGGLAINAAVWAVLG